MINSLYGSIIYIHIIISSPTLSSNINGITYTLADVISLKSRLKKVNFIFKIFKNTLLNHMIERINNATHRIRNKNPWKKRL